MAAAARPTPWWAVAVAVVAIVVLVTVAVSSIVPAQWFAETENRRLGELQPAPFARIPASAESVNDRVVFTDLPADVPRFETAADFFFVTVSAPQQSLLSWLLGRGEPTVDLLTEEDKFGRRTPSQNRQISLQQMRTATQEAQYLALLAAGYEPTIEPGEVVVQDVLCRVPDDNGFDCIESFPSDDEIDPADTILEIDGAPVGNLAQLSEELAGRSPGDLVDMKIRRPDVGVLDVTVELSSAPDDPDRTIVGFIPFDTATVDLPFDVSVDTGAIGGPSAGLAFTLALIDELTDGDLTGGRNIAVTGTIDLEGNVGPIGGLEQKVHAVQQHGVDVFIVPAGQSELAEPDADSDDVCRIDCLRDAGDGEVELVPVATLDEALAALLELGGDPIEQVTPS
ncbi:MAG: S16 family serine protease [Actinomycetota bacterium]